MSTVPARAAASFFTFAIAMTAAAGAQTDPPTEATKAPANRLEAAPAVQFQADSNVFQRVGPASSTFGEQSERFRDPQQREAVRAEQRAQILESHRDIAKLLQLDGATATKLIELLADLKTSELEQFYASAAAKPSPSPMSDSLLPRAQRETQKVQALRNLLGQEKLERYQAFETYINDYRQVEKLDARLDAGDKLSLDQKQRLAELWHQQSRDEIHSTRFSMRSGSPFGFGNSLRQLPSREEMQRNSQLMTIASNEESWRRMPEADERLRRRAAEFLTPPQLDALAQMNAERADTLRKWIEGARVQAGLSPKIPDEPETTQPPAPVPVVGDVKLAVMLSINGGEATHYTDTVPNGESVTFPCAGLFVEVRPTVYDNDWYDVRVLYYEPDSRGGRRLIGEGGQMGMVTRDSRPGGAGGTVITGNQGYAIELSTNVEPA
jgi:hypothetical protein